MSPEYREIPVDLILFSPFNTRGEVSEEELLSLAETMKAEGINLVPIKVRPTKGEPPYELVYGERRLRALHVAGLEFARCVVQEMTDEQVLMEQWVENEEHRDLPDYGKALKLKQILEANPSWTQAELGKRLGKDPSWISNHLRFLKLEGNISREMLWRLSEKQARAILSAPEDLIPAVCREVEAWMALKGALPSSEEIRGIMTLLQTEWNLSNPKEQPHKHVPDASGTHCSECGRPLSDPKSVAAGIGPVCASGGAASTSATDKTPTPTQPTLTKEERGHTILDEETAKWGELTPSFKRSVLMMRLPCYGDEADRIIKTYRPAKPEPKKAEPKPEAGEETPTEFEITLDVENADHSPGPQQKATITIPHGGKLKILIDGMVYTTFDPQQDPKDNISTHEEAMEPEEDEGKEIDEKEEEDGEEEEQLHQSTGPEEAA